MNISCHLCGGAGPRPIFAKEGVPFYACADCGFRFSRPATNPNYHEVVEDYEGSYLQYLEANAADEANHRAVLDWIRRAGGAVADGMLDVGCGSGKFVRFLRAQGVPASGIEPAAALYRRYLAGDPIFRCVAADELAATDPRRYSAITLLDVIEHVESPLSVLTSARGLLAPGGRIFLSTPDVESAFAFVCGRRWHFYNKYHLSYLSPRTLEMLCRRIGLRVAEVKHIGKRFPAGYLLRYARDFLTGGKEHPVPQRSIIDRISIPLNLFDIMYVCLEKME